MQRVFSCFSLTVLFLSLSIAHPCGDAKGKPSPPNGVVLEEVSPSGTAAKAGLLSGDNIVGWRREGAPPASPGASVTLASTFDLERVEMEEAPLGPVTLAGKRGAAALKVTLPAGDWKVSARPELSAGSLKLLDDAVKSGSPVPWDRVAGEELEKSPLISAWAWGKQGALLAGKSDAGGAMEAFDKALAAAKSASDPWAVSSVLTARGKAMEKMKDVAGALEAYGKALEVRTVRGPEGLAVASSLGDLGDAHLGKRDLDRAEEHHSKALAIRRRLTPSSLETAVSLNRLGTVVWYRGKLSEAEKFYRESLDIVEAVLPGSVLHARGWSNLGNVAGAQQELDKAEACFKRALDISEKNPGASEVIPATLNNLGVIYLMRGDLGAALGCYQRSLPLMEKEARSPLDIAAVWNNIGRVSALRGDLAGAEEAYRKSMEVKDRLAPGSIDTAPTLMNIGNLYLYRGDARGALDFYRRAYEVNEKNGPGGPEAGANLNNMGLAAMQAGDLEEAGGYFARALENRKKNLPGTLAESSVHRSLADLALKRGDLKRASAENAEAMGIREKMAPGGLEFAECLAMDGSIKSLAGEAGAARESFLKALDIRERLAPESSLVAESQHDLGELLEAGGDLPAAADRYARAVGALEAQYERLGGGRGARDSFSAHYADYYRDLVRVQQGLGRSAQAFETLERFRAKNLLAMLAERDIDFSADAPAELLRDLQRTDFRYDKVQEQVAGLSPGADQAKLDALLKEVVDLKRRRAELEEQIRGASPALAALRHPKALDLEGARRALPPGALFLSYCVGEKGTLLFALLGERFEVKEVPVSRADLAKQVRAIRAKLSAGAGGPSAAGGQLGRLYEQLIGPVKGLVSRSKSVLICPDGPLHSLPFAALQAPDGRFLVEIKPVCYTISATVFGELRRSGGTRPEFRMVAFGDPAYGGEVSGGKPALALLRGVDLSPLPSSRDEVDRICALVPERCRKFLGEKATEGEAKAVGKWPSHLHFACHGFFDEGSPLDSGLVFTVPEKAGEGVDNGVLQAWEVFERVKLDADLVTLSACETGLGVESGGEGLIGLTRAFQYAGARTVLSTLWSVPDRSTADLMDLFYREVRSGKSQAEALRSAQLALIRGGRRAPDASTDPRAWAAFQLNGSGL